MFNPRVILHPTDFSTRSLRALDVAGSLAREPDARLVILHVAEGAIAPLVGGGGPGILPPLRSDDPLEGIQEEMRKLPARTAHPDARVEYRLAREGDAVEIVLKVAREINAEVIVMGSHGRSGLGRLLMGSIAEEVLRQAPCPVLIVKTPSELGENAADDTKEDDTEEAVRDSLRLPNA